MKWLGVALAMGLAQVGCINVEKNLYEVVLSGQITVEAGATSAGQVHLEYHHALTVGEGDLAHPLGEFDREVIPTLGATSKTLLVPHTEGSGLVVYGWLDVDGDGTLCAPGKPRTEPAGIVEVRGYPGHALTYSLLLDTPCAGPETMYP